MSKPFRFIPWLCLLPTLAGAQTLTTSTTLAAAVTTAQTSILVSAADSSWVVGNYAYVDYEVLKITNVSGTLIGVARQQFGTKSTSHANSTVIIAGAGAHFKNLSTYQHSPPIGSCVRASQPYLPLIDYTSGNLWTCSASLGKWIGTNSAKLTYDSIQTP
jgi:hypothetical protein